MADYQLSYTGDQVNTAIGQIINKNITGTLTVETLDLTNSLAITQGGTGATTAADARGNLGIKSCGTYDILPVAKGGTGKTTAAEALNAIVPKTTSNGWTVWKFPDGRMVAERTEDYSSVNFNTVDNYWIRPSSAFKLTLPEGFNAAPKLKNAYARSERAGGTFVYAISYGATGDFSFWVFRHSVYSHITNIHVSIRLEGTWK